MEVYRKSIFLKFEKLPPIELKTVSPGNQTGWLNRLALASKRRLFSLRHDWEFELGSIEYEQNMNAKVIIPNSLNGQKIYFDGASIPLPWLVSLLTFGVLRPLGVMLIGSVVHDFAYKTGFLMINKDGKTEQIPIQRHIADRLLRDIISTVNNMPVVAFFGWLFVRFGWLFVRFNQQRFGGKVPYWEIPLAAGILILTGYLLINHTVMICLISLALYAGVSLLQKRADST